MFNAVHVTHEAVHKVGGIGTVLEGLINSRPYRDAVGRTVLVCPLFHPDSAQRLGPGGIIEYSSLDGLYDGPYAAAFQRIESEWGGAIVYGRRPLEDEPSSRRVVCEVLLIDLRGVRAEQVNALKGRLWAQFGLRSNLYEHIWEFEQYIELAGPAAAALGAMQLGAADTPAAVFAHEFMGVPTALALTCAAPERYRTLFYAHEVAPMRRITEQQPGHDIAFYRALRAAREGGLTVEQVFGPQRDYHKFAIVEAARHCDGLLAVGSYIQDELLFMGPEFERADVSLVYNGVPASRCGPDERALARDRVQRYFDAMLGWRPDLVFTHVTRFSPSKALWRDLDVLEALDGMLAGSGRTAVMLVLSTELPRRPLHDVLRMEREWDWPLAHREGPPDLTWGEARYFERVQAFNARARAVRVIFLNQFGFHRSRCGLRVPDDLEFLDLRRATDAEFGLSLYEPFGISPLEALTFGGLCVISTTCGCEGFLRLCAGTRRPANVVFADYVGESAGGLREAVGITTAERRVIERRVAQEVAGAIMRQLPAGDADRDRAARSGYELARRMSWDAVAERFVLPAVRRAAAHRGAAIDVA